jgi:hypothetical protein
LVDVERTEGRLYTPAICMLSIGEYLCGHAMLKGRRNIYRLYDTKFRPTQEGRIALTWNSDWVEPREGVPIEISYEILQFEVLHVGMINV